METPTVLDVGSLAHRLQQERLYVTAEKQLIQRLNSEVLKLAERVCETSWICQQQRSNLERLLLSRSTGGAVSPGECCRRARLLEDTRFVDAHPVLGTWEGAYRRVLCVLREQPRLMASCLSVTGQHTHALIHTVFTCVGAAGLMQEDEEYLLQVLVALIEVELRESDAPQQLMRRSSCSFSLLLRLFCERLHACRLFLTAALHQPVTHLLVEAQEPLETDPAKLAAGALLAQTNRAKLGVLAGRFVCSLNHALPCFPRSLRQVLWQVWQVVMERSGRGDAAATCAHLLLTCFICPAVVNPERYGIVSNAPINEVAHFNLTQVGRLLQQMALSDGQDGEPEQNCALTRSSRDAVMAFLGAVIDRKEVEAPPTAAQRMHEGLTKTAVYVTQNQLLALVDFLRSLVVEGHLSDTDRCVLAPLLSDLPPSGASPLRDHSESPTGRKSKVHTVSSRSRSGSAVELDLDPQESVQELQVPEEVLVISLRCSPQAFPGMMSETEVLSVRREEPGDRQEEAELQKGPNVLRHDPSNRSNSESSLELEGEAVGATNNTNQGMEALQLLEQEQATTCLDERLRKFMLMDECDASETTSEAWSMDVLDSDVEEQPEDSAAALEQKLQELDSCLRGNDCEVTEIRQSSSPDVSASSAAGISASWEEVPSKSEGVQWDLGSEPEEDDTVRIKPDPVEPAGLLSPKQRHSCPDHLSHSHRMEKAFVSRRPASEPGLQSIQAEEKQDSDEEKIDKSRSWWKKRLTSAIPKGAFRRKDKPEKEDVDTEEFQQGKSCVPAEGPARCSEAQAVEDILDKYRNIQRINVAETREPDQETDGAEDELATSKTPHRLCDFPKTAQPQTSSFNFRDAKKKLRLALCSTDTFFSARLTIDTRPCVPHEDSAIVRFLKVQLAEAITLQDKSQMAQIEESMRCVACLDESACEELLAAVTEDYRRRAPYVSYLLRCRQGLQVWRAHLERLLQQVLRDEEVTSRCLTSVCVRLLLERTDDHLLDFVKVFQSCTAADDKTSALEDFLRHLYGVMANDDTWQEASEEQLQEAQTAIERSVLSRVFRLAFYPNQDGDVLRDQLLHEHIERLNKVVTANHKALQIPAVYLKEAPWPSAQLEIGTMAAYRTPRDKVQCVLRMCSTIMNMLSLANEDSVPGADDFLPVLVFVLIKANPPAMLSTIQYITNFYGNRLSGEDSYWWMQFTAAVEFIKTIDDRT